MNMVRRRGESKTALVLAGGGFTGAVYEIGALRAIDDMLVDRSVNDFDIYVGTSAGAFVSAFLANGCTPDTMLQALDGSNLTLVAFERKDLFNLDRRELLRQGYKLPRQLLRAWRHYLHHVDDLNAFDLLWTLLEALPAGLYDSLALERFVRHGLEKLGGTNSFEHLKKDLHIVATDLDRGERAIFGRHHQSDVPISLAVAASTAVPLLYKPVRIFGRDYIDGGLRGNASIDVAIEHGATLVVCINPMVASHYNAAEGEHLSDKGMQAIAHQVSRINSHAGLHYHVKQIRRAHPEVDIIVIEPPPTDDKLGFHNVMRYSTRLAAARHGFETVTLEMAEEFASYRAVLARHGIPITQRLVMEELAEIQESDYDPEVIRCVLEAKLNCEAPRHTPMGKLNRTLAELDTVLDSLAPQAERPSPNGNEPVA
jgi:predicted acylesterase/phospholipase RssA